MTEVVQSYAHGTSAVPLIGQTIGENLAGDGRPLPRPRGARRPVPGRAADLRASSTPRSTTWPAASLAAGIEKGDRVGIWSPNCAEWVLVQYATARVGAILVNINPAYRTHEVAYALQPVGLPAAGRRDRASRPATTWRWSTEVRPTLAALERVVFLGTAGVGRARSPRATAVDRGRAARRGRPSSQFDDPINIQYTSGTTGFPKGATLSPPQHPEQRLLRRRGLPLRRARPGLHPRALLPLLRDGAWATSAAPRHGATMVVPGARVRPGGHAADGRRTSAARRSTACRRCSSPSSAHPDFHRFDLSSLRTGIMAGSPCPVEVMKQCVVGDAHGGGHDLLRHDRDVAGVDPDRRRRPARQAGRHRRPGAPPRRGQGRRSRHRATSCARGSPASSAPAATR